MLYVIASILSFLVRDANADCYMHNPRGSNNRLNERSANRNNGDRLFDSQNNNRGGYNVGDKTNNAATSLLAPQTVYNFDNNDATQYPMLYYEGSVMSIEWTAQHGCGGNEATDPQKLNCDMVIQYMCDVDRSDYFTDLSMNVRMRDGQNTNTHDTADTFAEVQANTPDQAERGKHENIGWYYMCEQRDRNLGLFHADQNLQGVDSTHTRQNPNGNRRGLECPEERDYYPYWNPSPWIDAAFLTDHPEDCDSVKAASQNNADVWYCDNIVQQNNGDPVPITQEECEATPTGEWKSFNKGLPPPDCKQGEWSRPNHLGNGRDGEPLTYNWTLPSFSTLRPTTGVVNADKADSLDLFKCVLRIRYNISTDDYDPKTTTSAMDEDDDVGFYSPVEQNPEVDIGLSTLQGLQLAINTAQFGRTFQDRSHIFYIKKRPTDAPWAQSTVYNLNVRGKRCNIVQCFPAVEYDYVPRRLEVQPGDAVHIQWTGSNTHNNGNPAGDGQAGDAGEGTGGTDRQNMAVTKTGLGKGENYPLPLDLYTDNLWSRMNFYEWSIDGNDGLVGGHGTMINDWVNTALIMSTSGQFRSRSDPGLQNFQELLNDAPASLVGGVMMQVPTDYVVSPTDGMQAEEFHFINTRNNNFSNRSQKGVLLVKA